MRGNVFVRPGPGPMVRAIFVLLFFVSSIVIGCGRSNIDDYLPLDGSVKPDVTNPDGGPNTCNAATCPTGCCDSAGKCRSGAELEACGGGGLACTNCTDQGFTACDSTAHQCKKDVPMCDVTSCPNGCCGTSGGQPTCFAGTGNNACGFAGQMCATCGMNETCDAQTHSCVMQGCNAQTCKGCCFGNQCQAGNMDTACGVGGVQCANCTGMMQFCNGGKCDVQPPKCGPNNCQNGCCAGDTCIQMPTDKQCGTGGLACSDCTAMMQVCSSGKCAVPPCSSQNCTGCCSGNTCNAGFANNSCGSGGANCVNCQAMNSTCNGLVMPRVCNSQQMTCPAPYGMCPNNVETPILQVSKGVCSAQDLLDARTACAQGPGAPTCVQFFQFITQQKPNCAKCLNPFDYNFNDFTGIYNCVAPYVTQQCRHTTGCVDDCANTSCKQCPNQQTQTQCTNQVKGFNGQCFSYVQGSQCIASGLFGQGSFCSPAQYFGNFGAWLQGVGAHYCGP